VGMSKLTYLRIEDEQPDGYVHYIVMVEPLLVLLRQFEQG
jgi:hypothetical protein